MMHFYIWGKADFQQHQAENIHPSSSSSAFASSFSLQFPPSFLESNFGVKPIHLLKTDQHTDSQKRFCNSVLVLKWSEETPKKVAKCNT